MNKPSQSQPRKQRNRNKNKKQSLQESVFAPKALGKGNGSLVRSNKKNNKGGLGLSKCAYMYALAISDPFNPACKEACVPKYPSPPSLKNTVITRFTATVGVQGIGFITLHPTIASDRPAVFFTTALYNLTNYAILSANNVLNTGVSSGTLPLPFPTTSLGFVNGGVSASGRIVSSGVRIRYTGTTMNESGTYQCYVSPSHDNVLAYASSPSQLGALLETDVSTVSRDPCSIAAFGIDAQECAYTASDVTDATQIYYPYSTSTIMNNGYTLLVTGSPCGIIGFSGVPGSTFLVEVIQHTEFTGPSAATLSSPTDNDTNGFELVQAASARLQLKKQSTSNIGRSVTSMMFEGIKEAANALKPIAVNKLIQFGTAMLL